MSRIHQSHKKWPEVETRAEFVTNKMRESPFNTNHLLDEVCWTRRFIIQQPGCWEKHIVGCEETSVRLFKHFMSNEKNISTSCLPVL